MAFVLEHAFPANAASNFKIEDRIKLTFNKAVKEETVNSGTIVLIERDTDNIVNIDFVVTGDIIEVYPSLALKENTGYKLIIVGRDLNQPAGYLYALDDTEFLYTQTVIFTTTVRTASDVVNTANNNDLVESKYIAGIDNKPILVETLKLKFEESDPTCGEMMISPAYLAEKGIRLTFNRPVDLDSAKKYIKLSHLPLAGIRAMAFDKEQLICSYTEHSDSNYCLSNRNAKLNPLMHYYVQGNDVLLTYPNTMADNDALTWVDPNVGLSSSSPSPFVMLSTSAPSVQDYDFTVFGEITEETHSFNFASHTTLYLTYESHVIKDRYLIYQGNKNTPIYDSGCVSTNGMPATVMLTIKPNVPFYVTILGGCDPNDIIKATAWNFRVTSFDPNAPSASTSNSSSEPTLSSSSDSGFSASSSAPVYSSSSEPTYSSSSEPILISSSAPLSSSSSCPANWDGPVLNAEVRITISPKLKSQLDTNGLYTTLNEDVVIYFLTGMFPIYADLDMVRITLDNLNKRYDDELILRLILKNSLEAWNISCQNFDLCGPSQEAIAYAELKTQLDIFDMTFSTNLANRGISKSLGDFSYRYAARTSNNNRNDKEKNTLNGVLRLVSVMRLGCGGNGGIQWMVKGRTNPTTKPNFRTRTYKYLASDYGWTFPATKGFNRYVELPSFDETYS